MSSNIVYNNVNKLLTQVGQDLQKLETGFDTSQALQEQITANFVSIKRQTDDLDEWGKKEITAIKREKALSRVAKVRDEHRALTSQFDKWKAQHYAAQAAATAVQERNELFGGRPTPIQRYRVDSHMDPHADSTILMMEQALNEQNAGVGASVNRLDEFILMGRQSLQELVDQRNMLKNTRRRMLDIANSLGLSTSVIRFIEQRTVTDRYILYGGMVLMVVLMYLIVRYFG
ncbi:hypothetical protein BJ742DRAFT_815114 [Cladochytrium replicatum]|nr:hypothetical protein BJ742DRAFT_815114 [Cladochytrium replicatum]